MMSFGYPPKGWALCNGQLLPINQNQALFSLFGTTYGGNGTTNFALPNLQGKVPLHMGQGFTQGQTGGETSHTLTISEMPQHPHTFQGTTNNADNAVLTGNLMATSANLYTAANNLTTLDPSTVANAGGSQPHENMQPYLTVNFCIALQGIFPSRN
ncbi:MULTISPECIES: phage tail protein [Bradyrhizobium]|jgi:microcystin-dependent protein|nr:MULTISPECIES: tail fiber protein [Bradyrhizobium]MBP1291933.1 microcystin-dependent protein [Bradyrhizobium elkanii]MBP2430249.1 microcystin-dependent protein [Bradyrhizobium elkanii]MCP1736411.1 microcystin-dependent protein [Bradyrhizobium elkanii]MCP1754308.1 microcystin-dependent protein [Bradyrhizobium elkanii]MCP1927629.1 microcystin-dependent protein [Bradyrhizobium elkanii]